MRAYFRVMRHSFDFTGRTGRSDFWWYSAITGLIWGALFIMARGGASSAEVAFAIFSVVHVIPTVAADVRRLRDAGRSPWWMLIVVIPLGIFFLTAFWCLPSAPPGRAPDDGRREEPNFDGRPRGATSLIGELEKLAALRATGAIDENEFLIMKERLMRMGAAE